MLVTVLTSIKLYLHLDDNLKNELEMSKHFHSLALKLYKILNLPRNQRGTDGLYFLNNKYGDYIKLVEQSALLRKYIIKDSLLEVPYGFISDDDISSDITTNFSNNEYNYFYFLNSLFKRKKPVRNKNTTSIKNHAHDYDKNTNIELTDEKNENIDMTYMQDDNFNIF